MTVKPGLLDLKQLDRAYVALVTLANEGPRPDFQGMPMRPLHQVTLRPDLIFQGRLIRLGETPSDEARGWMRPEHVEIVAIIAMASKEDGGNWRFDPLPDERLEVIHLMTAEAA